MAHVNRHWRCIILGVWMLAAVACVLAPARAAQFRSGDTVRLERGERFDDDLIVSGSNVTIDSVVMHDLVVAGSEVTINGPVHGNLIVAGGTVRVHGSVDGTVYGAAGTLNLDGAVGRNAVLAGGTVNTGAQSRIARDLVAAAGTLAVASTIGGDVRASTGEFTLADTARVQRDVMVQTNTSRISPDAAILGAATITPTERREDGVFRRVVWPLLQAITWFAIGVLFLTFTPRLLSQVRSMARAHPWASMLAGLIMLFLTPLVIFLLLITIIGIPLALILATLYALALFISPVFVAILGGQRLLRNTRASIYIALLLGVLILFVLQLIPVLGPLATFLAILFGLGVAYLALQGRTAHPLFPSRAI